ncbi:hypothetical protein WJX73_008785 [Symbiochloris irregularis]|uniref:K Homology domain-containing protein n=1 Tax=Symbiochloris irregularis TaxID=706552 RepID=A0AAW1P0I8_9CHLO
MIWDLVVGGINQKRVEAGRLRRKQQEEQNTVCLVDEDSGRIKWIQPSGPRRPGEGIEDVEQGIVSAEGTPTGGALLRMTLLASGFVIGTSGQTVRDICKKTSADIKSWTDTSPASATQPTRIYVIEGRTRAVMLALTIVCDAVDRYKELCEGRYCGESVSRIQTVHGIDFMYQPPPRNVVPYAASLKNQGNASSATRVLNPLPKSTLHLNTGNVTSFQRVVAAGRQGYGNGAHRHVLEDVPEEFEDASGTPHEDTDMPNGCENFARPPRRGRSSHPSYQRPSPDALYSPHHQSDVYMSPAAGLISHGHTMMTDGSFCSSPEIVPHMMYTPLKHSRTTQSAIYTAYLG